MISIEVLLIIFFAILCIIGLVAIRWKKKLEIDHQDLKQKYAEKEMHYRTLAENSPDLIVRYDVLGRRTYVNQTYERVTGIPIETLIGKTITENSVVTGPASFQLQDNIFKVFQEGINTSYEVKFNVNGRDYFYDYRCIPEKDKNGNVQTVLAVGRDITSYKELEIQLNELVKTDLLTGVLNRRSFLEKLTIELYSVKRYHVPACLMVLDIDYLKRINDTHGHAAGNAALLHFSNLIKSTVRASDSLSRLNEGKFTILLPRTSFSMAEKIAERLRSLIYMSYAQYQDIEIKFTTSIGITNITIADIDINDVISRGEKALSEAKIKGRNKVESYQI